MIELEPFAEHHLPGVAAMLEDPDVLRFTRVPVPVPAGFPETWLARYEEARANGSREAFAVMLGGEFAGLAVVPTIDRAARTVELGYVVAPAARGRGVATEALRRLTAWAFDEIGALRIELLINAANDASKRVASKCGYVREGVLRSAHVKGDLREDTEIWSKLPSDP